MKSKEINREKLREEIINRIETEFPGVIARWIGLGTPADDFKDDTERFAAYMVTPHDLERFVHFVRLLRKEIGKPRGFSIMVHPLNAENTTNFHLQEYKAEKAKRTAHTTTQSKLPSRKSSRSVKKPPKKPVGKLNNKSSKS